MKKWKVLFLVAVSSTLVLSGCGDKKGNNSEVTSDMFLKLMLEQLQYQDPLNPVSNTEFLSQQAMFTQLEKIMDIDSEVSSSNAIQQTLSLVGKEVTITDPDNKNKTITFKSKDKTAQLLLKNA